MAPIGGYNAKYKRNNLNRGDQLFCHGLRDTKYPLGNSLLERRRQNYSRVPVG